MHFIRKFQDSKRGASILLNLPIDTLRYVPLHYMHVVLLSVVKLLSLWASGPLNIRLGPLARLMFTEQSSTLRPHIPCEFPRKPRGLDKLDGWKAVKFQLILYYTGPVLLKLTLPYYLYENSLFLCAALSILACKELC